MSAGLSEHQHIGTTHIDAVGVLTLADSAQCAQVAFPLAIRPGLIPGCLVTIGEIEAYAVAASAQVVDLLALPGVASVGGVSDTYIITETAIL